MPRANRRRRDEPPARPLGGGSTSTERYAGSLWTVRRVTGEGSTRPYLCPGCQQNIPVGLPNVVAWPADGVGGVGDRRHWHTGCWQRRDARPSGNAYR
ncbi:hypothetical protein [Lapillicoccus sp.]|uniref:hypothetical protein n=1 Tax=Lapillicoccus sp. TaxID=1909287 RepID=UPI0025EFC802|nr:hypothetical protein [Lapillicoccus sp.]